MTVPEGLPRRAEHRPEGTEVAIGEPLLRSVLSSEETHGGHTERHCYVKHAPVVSPTCLSCDILCLFSKPTLRLLGDAGPVLKESGAVIGFLKKARASLCGVPGCGANWNPNLAMLALVAGASDEIGLEIRNNATFQGGAYVVNDIKEWNNATVWGPVIARRVQVRNNASHELAPLGTLLPGMPAETTTSTTLENVEESFASS